MQKHHSVICDLPRSAIFYHIISQTEQLLKKKTVLKIKCVFRCCLQHFSEIFFILIIWARCFQKRTMILIKLEFSRHISKKIFQHLIWWKSIKWEQSCSMRTDRRKNMTKLAVGRFPQFCELTQNFGQTIVCCNIKLDINILEPSSFYMYHQV
jgi:hypothetical protein